MERITHSAQLIRMEHHVEAYGRFDLTPGRFVAMQAPDTPVLPPPLMPTPRVQVAVVVAGATPVRGYAHRTEEGLYHHLYHDYVGPNLTPEKAGHWEGLKEAVHLPQVASNAANGRWEAACALFCDVVAPEGIGEMTFPAEALLLDEPEYGHTLHFGVIVSHGATKTSAFAAPDPDALYRLIYQRYVRDVLDFTDPEELDLSDLAVVDEDYSTAVPRWFDEHGMGKNGMTFLYVSSAKLER